MQSPKAASAASPAQAYYTQHCMHASCVTLFRCHRMLVRAPQKHAHHCILPSVLGVASLPFVSFSGIAPEMQRLGAAFAVGLIQGCCTHHHMHASCNSQNWLVPLSATRHVISAAQQMFPLMQSEVIVPIKLTRLLMTLP